MELTKSQLSRFWSKVIKSDQCWVWVGCRTRGGYGCFSIQRKSFRAHRVSWWIHNGEIKSGNCICHKCDNPKCVNPDHLFSGTITDNNRDMFRKKRDGYSTGKGYRGGNTTKQFGERNSASKLTLVQVCQIRDRYSKGGILMRQLGSEFGVKTPMISKIINGKNWVV